MKMPFGKHRGRDIHKIPRRYLKWCLREITNMTPQLRRAMECGIDGIEYTPPSQQTWAPHQPDEVTGY